MQKSFKQKSILAVIRIGRRFFYKTPIQRNKYVGLLYQKIFRSAYAPGQELIVDYEGAKFYFPSDDITILPSLLNDSYEKVEFSHFKDKLKKGMIVADVGANIGLYSIVAAQAIGKSGKVHSFEPEPSNYALLVRNMELNKCINIDPQQKAVARKKGKLKLYMEEGSIGTHSLLAKNYGNQKTVDVDVICLDDFFKNKPMPDIMKLDVEGLELDVMLGAKKVIAHLSCMFFEYNRYDKQAEKKALSLILRSFSKLEIVNEKSGRLLPISIETMLELRYANIVASK